LIDLAAVTTAVTLLPKSAVDVSGTAASVATLFDGTVSAIEPWSAENPDLPAAADTELEAVGLTEGLTVDVAEAEVPDSTTPAGAMLAALERCELQPARNASAQMVIAAPERTSVVRYHIKPALPASRSPRQAEKARTMIPPNRSPSPARFAAAGCLKTYSRRSFRASPVLSFCPARSR
jgi:hypothetical protein